MDMLLPLLTAAAPRALYVIIFIVGLVMALSRRARHPGATRLAVIAFVILIVEQVLQVANQAYVMSQAGHLGAETIRVITFMGLANVLLGVVGTTLLVLAVFADRGTTSASAVAPATTSASG
jgi:hypothetical protein